MRPAEGTTGEAMSAGEDGNWLPAEAWGAAVAVVWEAGWPVEEVGTPGGRGPLAGPAGRLGVPEGSGPVRVGPLMVMVAGRPEQWTIWRPVLVCLVLVPAVLFGQCFGQK